jgi:tetratricopeptide (TPR) repeat protein
LHEELVGFVAFSPDGRKLVAAGGTSPARLWDVATGKQIGEIRQPEARFERAAFSPDGRTLLTESWRNRTDPSPQNVIRFWDVATGKQLGPALFQYRLNRVRIWPQKEEFRYEAITSLAFTPDGRKALIGTPAAVRSWDVPSPMEGTADRIRLWVQTITMRELDASGVVLVQTVAAWQQRRQLLTGEPPPIAAADPKAMRLYPVSRDPNVHYRQGLLLLGSRVPQRAAAIVEFRKAIELNPEETCYHNSLAWLLATCPEPKLRDPDQAVALAKHAIERMPNVHPYWRTLGVAYYRAKKWEEALTALTKSCQLEQATGGKGNAWQWLWLAMAHWQLGHKDEARSWYDKAVQLETVWPEELLRFETEAADLLGVPTASRPPPARRKMDENSKTKAELK